MADEFEVIAQYFYRQPRDQVVVGIGDDAALLQLNQSQLLVCTDTLVEGRHFPSGENPFNIAYKALAVNLSDIAAMGGAPKWFTLNLTLPSADADWLQAFATGLFELAQQYDLQLIGGDTTSGPLSVSITLMAESGPKLLTRAQGQVGDAVYVTGSLGDAALAFKHLQGEYHLTPTEQSSCLAALQRPQPQLKFISYCASYINACIDVSDGLLADLGHICRASQCSATLYQSQLPVSDAMHRYLSKTTDWASVVSWGDDYQLCCSVDPANEAAFVHQAKIAGVAVTRIGSLDEGEGVSLLDEHSQAVELREQGFNHFIC